MNRYIGIMRTAVTILNRGVRTAASLARLHWPYPGETGDWLMRVYVYISYKSLEIELRINMHCQQTGNYNSK
jgi:hypothetical protein